MAKITEIINKIEKKYPLSSAESWDFAGFSVASGKVNKDQECTGIVLAIDVTKEVLEKAIAIKANLIITHHPFIFNENPLEEIKNYPYKRDIVKKAIDHQICFYSLHTSYDSNEHGTSYQLAKKIFGGYFEIGKVSNYSSLVDLKKSLDPIDINPFLRKSNVQIIASNVQNEKKFDFINVYAGSGDAIEIIKNYNPNHLIITSDVKWNEWVAYNQSKVNVIQISHQHEEVFVDHFSQFLLYHFPAIPVLKIYLLSITRS